MNNKNNTVPKGLNEVSKGSSSKWQENAEWRRQNRSWLNRSAHIAIQVLDELEKKEWNQKKLAQEMDVSPQYISKVLSGKENLGLQTIDLLERVLGISISISGFPIRVDYEADLINYKIYNPKSKSKYQIKSELCLIVDTEGAPISDYTTKVPEYKQTEIYS